MNDEPKHISDLPQTSVPDDTVMVIDCPESIMPTIPQQAPVKPKKKGTLITKIAEKYSVDPDKMLSTLKATAFKQGKDAPVVTNEQMMSLLIVADQYNLNPFTKEIYAFPAGGGVQPIVSVDGWLKLINSHPNFDGMEFVDTIDKFTPIYGGDVEKRPLYGGSRHSRHSR